MGVPGLLGHLYLSVPSPHPRTVLVHPPAGAAVWSPTVHLTGLSPCSPHTHAPTQDRQRHQEPLELEHAEARLQRPKVPWRVLPHPQARQEARCVKLLCMCGYGHVCEYGCRNACVVVCTCVCLWVGMCTRVWVCAHAYVARQHCVCTHTCRNHCMCTHVRLFVCRCLYLESHLVRVNRVAP